MANEERNKTIYRLICNFAPRGNLAGQAVYNDGVPCSRCPYGGCDTEYKYLCSSYSSTTTATDRNYKLLLTTKYTHNILHTVNFSNVIKTTAETKKTKVMGGDKLNEERKIIKTDLMTDNDTNFDIFSYLLDGTLTYPTNFKQTTLPCKEVLAVEEFIELLKNKLNSDQSLKDLLSTTNTPTADPSVTDKTVAAIINQLYSKKETVTTSKPTVEETVNSTLLADLVEAVIFRHNDKFSTTEDSSQHLQTDANVSPIKIQAELPEIPANSEITGHYFFPEEEEEEKDEKTELETTENYDDLNISEISLEIDYLKKNRLTKDFIEEILESEFITENIIKDPVVLSSDNVAYVTNIEKRSEVINSTRSSKYNRKKVKRIKRRLYDYVGEEDNDRAIFIKYSDLLKQLAADLRKLRLNQKFHCSSGRINNAGKDIFLDIIILYTLNVLK